MAKKLTAKQEQYCRNRASGKSPKAAYEGAFNCSRMKPTTISNNAYMLEKRSDITARINELQAPAIEKVRMTAENIVTELENIGNSNVQQVIGPDGGYLPLQEWPEDIAKAIQSIEMDAKGNVVKFKLWNKPQALNMLGKHHGIYEKHNRQQTQNNLLLAVGKMPDNMIEAMIERLDAYAAGTPGSRPPIEGTATRLS